MVGFEGMSYDRVIRLASQLPIESRLMKKVHKIHQHWDLHYLLANLIDVIQENTWVTGNAHLEKSKRGKFPKRFYRPGDLLEKEARIIPKVVLDKLLKQKENNGR